MRKEEEPEKGKRKPLLIWCALQGKARVIISGDNHLLSFASSPVPIVTVQEFLEQKGK